MINSAPDPDQLPIAPMPAPSSAELELLRQQTIRALGSVAAALESAAKHRQKLLAEVRTAEHTLQELASERETAGARLAATRAQLTDAAAQLELAQVQRTGILSEVQGLHSAGLKVHDEVAALQRRRDELARQVVQSTELVQAVAQSEVLALAAAHANTSVAEPAPAAGPMHLEAAGVAEPTTGAAAAHEHPTPRPDLSAPNRPDELRPRAAAPPPSWPELIRASRPRIDGAVQALQRGVVPRRGATRQGIKRLVGPIHFGFSQIATGGLIALLLGLAVLLTPLTQVFGGLQLLAVMSGSMEPTIPVGGIVAIRPVAATDLKVGDAITFVNLSNPDVLVTHRIVSLEVRDGQTMLTTKGDANDSVDALSAPATRAVGRVEFALPYLGYLMVWLGTPLAKIGIVALAVLGLVLTSVQRSNTPSAPARGPGAEDTYLEHERNIQSLLGQ